MLRVSVSLATAGAGSAGASAPLTALEASRAVSSSSARSAWVLSRSVSSVSRKEVCIDRAVSSISFLNLRSSSSSISRRISDFTSLT